MTTVTNTPSEYVILIVFSRAAMVRPTHLDFTLYAHCLYCYNRESVCLLRGRSWVNTAGLTLAFEAVTWLSPAAAAAAAHAALQFTQCNHRPLSTITIADTRQIHVTACQRKRCRRFHPRPTHRAVEQLLLNATTLERQQEVRTARNIPEQRLVRRIRSYLGPQRGSSLVRELSGDIN